MNDGFGLVVVAVAAGGKLGGGGHMVALRRDGLTLPIFLGRPQPGTILEIGVDVPLKEIERISARLPEEATGFRRESDNLFFEDPFGYRWQINGSDEGFLSNGEIGGRSLER